MVKEKKINEERRIKSKKENKKSKEGTINKHNNFEKKNILELKYDSLVKLLFGELKSNSMILNFFEIILGLLILYYILFFILKFFMLEKYYNVIFLILFFYFFYKIFYYYKRDELNILKKTNYYLYEKLSALKENFNKKSIIKLQLEKEVLEESKNIETKDFFNTNSFVKKIVVLLLIILLSTPVSVYNFDDVKNIFKKKIIDNVDKKINGELPWLRKVQFTGIYEKSNTNSTKSIYNENQSVLSDAKQIISLNLKTSSNSLDLKTFKKIEDIKKENTLNNNFNFNIKTSNVYNENLPLNKYDVVKKYFTQ